MSRRILVIVIVLAALGAGWYFFRPERALLDRRVNEAAPDTAARVVLQGTFRSVAHDGSGRAVVLALPDGGRMLRFEEFATLDGPDLQVYLLGAADVTDNDGLARHGFISLGALKGNRGPQNYEIPAGTDLGRYPVVSVWCRRFGVNFTVAALTPRGS